MKEQMNIPNDKPITIYHSADFDGIFCREIARYAYPDQTFIGWNFGDPQIEIPEGFTNEITILDLPPECVKDVEHLADVVWVDHHKTSIDKWGNKFVGFQVDGVAACRLAWQYLVNEMKPTKEQFVNREVNEPYAVRLAGEYDVWDKRDANADTFQYALRAYEPDFHELLLLDESTKKAVGHGVIVQSYAERENESICNSKSWMIEWEGLKFLCINAARFNSLLFAAKDIPETGHDALLGFCFNGKCWTVSLYHAKHNTSIDLSDIAKRNGGGGHRGACGFTCQELPAAFLTKI